MMHNFRQMVLVFALLTASGLSARELHVVPTPAAPPAVASDGSAGRPFTSVQAAVTALEAGDTLLFHAGVHRLTAPVRFGSGGRADAWVTLRPAGNGEVILDGTDAPFTDEMRPRLGGTGMLHVEGPSYVRIEGLVVRHSKVAGIFVRGPSRHIEIRDCRVEHTYSSGIGIWNTHDVKVIGNTVVDANNDEYREPGTPKPFQTPHEAITLAGVSHFEVAYNRVRDCGKEGIDVKETSRHGRVHHNIVTGMARQGLYADAWFGRLEDISFDHNYVADCEWGVAISCEGHDATLRRIWIHHNVILRSRGSAIYTGRWGLDGPRREIVIAHNTMWGNGTVDHWSGATGGVDLRSLAVHDVTVVNNLVVNSGAFGIGVRKAESGDGTRPDLVVRNNLVHPWVALTAPPNERFDRYGASEAVAGVDTLRAEPLFVAAEEGDFRLRENSPARGHAVAVELPHASSFADLGADPAVAQLPVTPRP